MSEPPLQKTVKEARSFYLLIKVITLILLKISFCSFFMCHFKSHLLQEQILDFKDYFCSSLCPFLCIYLSSHLFPL